LPKNYWYNEYKCNRNWNREKNKRRMKNRKNSTLNFFNWRIDKNNEIDIISETTHYEV
jgi:hypothetical protein